MEPIVIHAGEPGDADPCQAARRGRPRSEKARMAILEAAAELLLTRGLGAVSMNAVAGRAGVSKATIYRWWPSKETLALDALYHEWAVMHPPARDTGPLHADLVSLLCPWVELLGDRPYGSVVAALIAEARADSKFAAEYRARFVGPRREHGQAIFRRAIERGEIAADTDVELALDLVYGPLYHRLLQGHLPLDDGFVRDVVDAVVRSLAPRQAHASADHAAHAFKQELAPLTVDDVLAWQRQGAQILDTRDPFDFELAHLAGAVNVGLGGNYATWCGAVLDRERPVVIVADPGREQEAAVGLGRTGVDIVEGYLEGGIKALQSWPDRVARIERVTAPVLAEQRESHEPPLIVDVRTELEWIENRIDASVNLPLDRLTQGLDRLPEDRALVVHCAEGYRSAIAASLLLRAGFAAVADLVGGLAAWQSCNLETVGVQAH
jgi:rhodanese-related sulfurtransferase/AcrR family transcriptional regulator